MARQQTIEWRGDWSVEAPADIGYAWAPNEGGDYVPAADGFEWRDLGVDAASNGVLGVTRGRVADRSRASEWRALDLDFNFLYILRGSVSIEDENGDRTHLDTGGSAWHGRNARHRFLDPSDDLEVFHVTSPAWDRTNVAGNGSESTVPAPIYTHEGPDDYIVGNGPRKFFAYRDLRTREVTDNRIHIHVVRSTVPGPGTGWHYHTMAQLFLVIEGQASLQVEGQPRYPITWGDAMCIGRGPNMRHDLGTHTSDYGCIEICVPGDYETIAVDPPAGAIPG